MSFEDRMKPRRLASAVLLAGGSLLVAAGNAGAQEAAELPPLVVEGATAYKPKVQVRSGSGPGGASAPAVVAPAPATPSPAGTGTTTTTGIAVDEIGSAVTVVTGAQLRSQQIRHAADALRSLPGVAVSRTGSAGGLTQVRIRGAEGNHTLVLIDGIEANDSTNGEFDFSDLSAEDIERIEVIRGAQSSLYGSGAIGGVINIITRGGRGPLTLAGRLEGGSFETSGGSVRVSGGNDKIWGSLTYDEIKTSGFNISSIGDERDGANRATFSFRGGVEVMQGLTVDASLRHVNKTGERDTEDFSKLGFVRQRDELANFETKVWLAGANARWEMLDGALTHQFKITSNKTDRYDSGDLTDPFGPFSVANDGDTLRYSYDATLRFVTPGVPAFKHAITGFIERERESFIPLSDFTDNVERERKRVSPAVEWRGDIASTVFLTAGVRRDESDVFEDFTTWRTTGTVKIPGLGLRPHASYGTGVKYPTMFEQFGTLPNSFTPNPNLLPEESKGWDAGLEFATPSRGIVLDVTYFEANLLNRINGLAPGPSFTFTPVNVPGESLRDGIEVSGTAEILPGLTLGASYTHLITEDATGIKELRRPEHSGRVDLGYVFDNGRGNLNVAAIYNGEMDDSVLRVTGFAFGFATAVRQRYVLDDYWLLNVAASYQVMPNFEIFGRVENALDQDYEEVFGFQTAGVAAYGGLRIKLEDAN